MECDDAARGWRDRRRRLARHLSHYEPSDSPEHSYVRAQYLLDLLAQLTSKSRIALYVVTGVVSALFCIIIASGVRLSLPLSRSL
jgi:hypothetical protein